MKKIIILKVFRCQFRQFKFSENSVDLIDLIIQIWKDKYYTLFIVLSFLAFSIYQLNNATFTYDIFLKVTPSKQMSDSQQ